MKLEPISVIIKNINEMKTFSALIFSFVIVSFAYADFSSTNFQLENPINIIEGGQSTSPSFKYFSSTGQLTTGQSTSSSFVQNAGFLYFPTATSPVISAVPGDSQVVLNWTPATGILANITNYEVGISNVSGGVFTYTSVGNVLTNTKDSLSNGTTYFFKIRSYAAGLLLSESVEVSATPIASTPRSSGGGISPVVPIKKTGVIFSGRAYPLSKVSILKDGQLMVNTIAGPDSNFSVSFNELSSGNYNFSIYGTDKNGLRSNAFTFQVFITSGVTTKISGIFITPTISVNKKEVKRGDNITIFGQSIPNSQIVISVNSPQEFFKSILSDESGVYLYNMDTSILDMGKHLTKSKALKNSEISSFSDTVGFIVGTKNVFLGEEKKVTKCDLNEDGRCNLVDFSIVAFRYKRPLSEDFIIKEIEHLNGDGKIDLVDFSIMAFYWTG